MPKQYMYNTTNKPIVFTEHITILLQNNLRKDSQHSRHEFYIQNFYIFHFETSTYS